MCHRQKMFEQAREGVRLDDYPVHVACRDGDVQSLTKYVGLRQDKSHLTKEDNFYSWTPLHFASFFGQLPALIVLREAGVSVDLTNVRFQQTAAHVAAFAGSDHCLKYLVHFGCNVNKQDYLGETPLHKAARSGSVLCGRVLAADGRALPHVLNNCGQTAATLAAACGHTEMATCLAEYEGRCSSPHIIGGVMAVQSVPCQGGGGGGLPALNGGLVPARSAPADSPWCYQPPPPPPPPPAASPAAGPGPMDTAGGDRGPATVEPGHPVVRHQTHGVSLSGLPNGLRCSATVGNPNGGGGDAGGGWHSNGLPGAGSRDGGFRKRSREEVFCADMKRRRLLGGAERPSSPGRLGVAAGGLMAQSDPCGRG